MKRYSITVHYDLHNGPVEDLHVAQRHFTVYIAAVGRKADAVALAEAQPVRSCVVVNSTGGLLHRNDKAPGKVYNALAQKPGGEIGAGREAGIAWLARHKDVTMPVLPVQG
jgi:hypothetical protein